MRRSQWTFKSKHSGGGEGRSRTVRWRAHLVVGVVALRPLRPRRAGGPSRYQPLAGEARAPLCAARRLAARAVPPRRTISHRSVWMHPFRWSGFEVVASGTDLTLQQPRRELLPQSHGLIAPAPGLGAPRFAGQVRDCAYPERVAFD